MTLTFNEDETQHLLSMYRIAKNEDNRANHNITVQRAEAKILELVGEKIVEVLG